MLASSMCSGVLVSYSTPCFAWYPLLSPALRVHLQILNHLRGERSIRSYPVARTALVFSSVANARPHQRIWPKIALDVGRDDLSRDFFAGHKPLVCSRHSDVEVWRKGM